MADFTNTLCYSVVTDNHLRIDSYSQYSSIPLPFGYKTSLPQNPVTVFPDFTKIVNVDDKKRQFLDYMQSFLDAENQEIMILRSRLLEIRKY